MDIAAAAGNEGVDERRETRRPDPPSTGQQHDGPRRRPVSRGDIGSLRHRSLRLSLAGCGGGADLDRGRAACGEHGLEVGDERGRERVALRSVLAGGRLHRPRRRRERERERLLAALLSSGTAWGRRRRRRGEEGKRGRERGVRTKEGSGGGDEEGEGGGNGLK